MEIRLARPADAMAIEAIYAHYVCTSTCTWQEEPGTLAERRQWLDDHGPSHPVIVALKDGELVGWGALSPFNRRSGYRFSVEDSVYVRADRHRRGVGRALLGNLVARAETLGYRNIVAGVAADQTASVALHEAFGFTVVARMPRLGHKFGRWHDLVYLQWRAPALRSGA